MTYGGPAPNFQAHLTVPAGENLLDSPNLASFTVDAQNANTLPSAQQGNVG